MKKFIPIIIAGLVFLGFTLGCEKVDEPFLKPIGKIGPEPEPEDTVRIVLLEDYTGHKCVNCPAAAEIAHNLSLQYGKRLVLLAIHAGYWATPEAGGFFTRDFRTPEGNAWNGYFGVELEGNPSGMINRIEYEGKLVMGREEWENAVGNIINALPQANIKVTKSYETSTRTLSCNLETTFYETLDDATFNICVVLTESGIVAPQQGTDSVIENYVHNHVLRTSLNGAWGLPVGVDGTAVEGVKLSNEYELVIPEEFVAENCAVVAFIYNTETHEIIQAAEQDVID